MPGLYSVTARVSWEGRVLFKLGASIWKRLGIESAAINTRFVLEFTMNLPLHWETHGFQAPKDHPSSSFPGFWHMPAKLNTEPAFRSVWVCVCVCVSLFSYFSIHLISIYLSLSVHLPVAIYRSLSTHISIYPPTIHRSIDPSIHLSSIDLSLYLSICIYSSIHPSIHLSISLSLYPFISLTLYISISLPTYLIIYPSSYLSIHLSVCLSIYLSIYLSLYLSVSVLI